MGLSWVQFCLIFLVATQHQVFAWRPMAPMESTSGADGLCFKFRVHIIDGFSNNNNPLLLHCWSLDDDLGNHTLYIGGDFNFKFGLKVFGGKTRFTCSFNWGAKHQQIDVFRDNIEASLCCVGDDNCYWRTQDDGIYFSVDNQNWSKSVDWLQ
ncbi:S-protein homolog 2 [Ricinus communis]|uniref:S-protein homolog 2 n=1 Tax=Ricinus communis TaxID=3988 RepID=UPI00201B25D6|nr:S-protein homolog 2 [Ricinus communis]